MSKPPGIGIKIILMVSLDKRTILITGAAGFIGTNLTQKLLESSVRIIAVDNFYSGSKENIKLFNGKKNYLFIEHDIRLPLKIRQKIDEIYNLACPASPPIYQKNPIFTLETSVLGIKNVLELAIKNKAKVLQASTSEIYGDPLVHPQVESNWGNVNPVGPRSCYDEGKRAVETFCYEYFNLGVDVRVMRIFNTYGPFMNPTDGRVIINFIKQALAGEKLTVFGDGKQTRSFCYIDDLIEGMMKYMMLEKRYFGPINLGNSEEFTIFQLAKIILKLIPKSKSKICFEPLPTDDPIKRRPNISRAGEILNWEPKVSLETGLKKMIDFVENEN